MIPDDGGRRLFRVRHDYLLDEQKNRQDFPESSFLADWKINRVGWNNQVIRESDPDQEPLRLRRGDCPKEAESGMYIRS
jgi:hypothetical protein